MPSALATIADEVADLLTAASASGALSQSFTAERVYEPRYEKEDTTLRVQVIAIPTATTEIAAGDLDAHDYVVEIGVLKRCDQTDEDAVDAMIELVEEIRSYLRNTAGEVDGYNWISSEFDPLYDHEKLKANVFASVQRITYRNYEDIRPFEPSFILPLTATGDADGGDEDAVLFTPFRLIYGNNDDSLDWEVRVGGVLHDSGAGVRDAIIEQMPHSLVLPVGVSTVLYRVRRTGTTIWKTHTIIVTVAA